MKKLSAIGMAALLLLSVCFSINAQNLIQNGSFEQPGFTNEYGQLRVDSGSLEVSGWSVVGGNVFLHQYPIGPSLGFGPAQDGLNYVDLSGAGIPHGTIYQDISTFPGVRYSLSFYVGSSSQSEPTINVRLDGAKTLINTNVSPRAPNRDGIDWLKQTFTFVADTNMVRLSFVDTSGSDDNSSYVDNVSLTPSVQVRNLFAVSDGGVVCEYTPDGVRSNVASGLISPQSLAFDRNGNLFFANGAGIISKLTSNGFQPYIYGISSPAGLACDNTGNIFMANWYGGIAKYTPDGIQSTNLAANNPWGLAFDGFGDLYYSSRDEGAVYKYTTNGSQSVYADGLLNPSCLIFDDVGNLFVSELFAGRIIKILSDGSRQTFASDINRPVGLAIDNDGNLFVASHGDNMIYKFTPSGERSVFASGLVGPTYLAFEPVFPVRILCQPNSQTATIGSTVRFSVNATNTPPQMTYQWFFGTNAIVGATSSTLVLTNVQSSQSGSYTVTVTGVNGSVTSDPAMLSVLPGIGVSMVPRIEVAGDIGANYRIEFVNAIGPTDAWQSLTTVTVTSNPQYYHDDSAIGQPQRFYRLVQVP